MKKQLMIIGIIVILLTVGLSGCTINKHKQTPNTQDEENVFSGLDSFYNVLENSTDKNIVVVTHFPPIDDIVPSKKAIEPQIDMDRCGSVVLWVYGHLHLTPFYDDSPSLVNYIDNISFVNCASIADSHYGDTPPTSFVMYITKGSKNVTIKYRNHETETWLDSYVFDFDYVFNRSTTIWFYSDVHIDDEEYNVFRDVISEMNRNVVLDYSFCAGDLTYDCSSCGYLFNEQFKEILAKNYYVLGNHDVSLGNGNWTLFPKDYYVDIGNLRIICMSPTYEYNY